MLTERTPARRFTYRLRAGDPQSRVFNGVKYVYWFHADTRQEAERLVRDFSTPQTRIRVVKKSRGYDIYGNYGRRK